MADRGVKAQKKEKGREKRKIIHRRKMVQPLPMKMVTI